MTKKLLVLPGDGIGPEIVAEAVKLLEVLRRQYGLDIEMEQGLIGGAACDAVGHPLPEGTVRLAQAADAVLLGAVGGPKWESLDISVRPEKGLLGIRAALELFANLRPAILYPQLASASTLKAEVVAGLDMDYLGNPFGPIPKLMAIAEYVTKVHAICIRCGNLAQYSHRTIKGDEQLYVTHHECPGSANYNVRRKEEQDCRIALSLGATQGFSSVVVLGSWKKWCSQKAL